jgi:hypothetical protein
METIAKCDRQTQLRSNDMTGNALTGNALRDALGAVIAEIKVKFTDGSFLLDGNKITNINDKQKELLEAVAAVFAATDFFAKEDIARDFAVTYTGKKGAQPGGSKGLPSNTQAGTPKGAAPESLFCCARWEWDPIQKKLVCKQTC